MKIFHVSINERNTAFNQSERAFPKYLPDRLVLLVMKFHFRCEECKPGLYDFRFCTRATRATQFYDFNNGAASNCKRRHPKPNASLGRRASLASK